MPKARDGRSYFYDELDKLPNTLRAGNVKLSKLRTADGVAWVDSQDDWERSNERAFAGLTGTHDDVRVLPRTNLVKRMRSITFILEEVGPDGYGENILAVHTLLIAPQSYQQSEPNRSTVVQTLGGAFIDDFGLGLKQINIAGTTGYSKRFVMDQQPYMGLSEGDPTPEMMATDGYHAFKKLRDDIYRSYFDLGQKFVTGTTDQAESNLIPIQNRNVATGDVLKDKTGWEAQSATERREAQGAGIADQLNRNALRNKPNTTAQDRLTGVRLKMFFWGNEDYYVVHPIDFSFSQSADEPVLYRYNMSFLVIKDLNAAEAEYDLKRAAAKDPFINLTDARYRSVRVNEQLNDLVLFQIVERNYKQFRGASGDALMNTLTMGAWSGNPGFWNRPSGSKGNNPWQFAPRKYKITPTLNSGGVQFDEDYADKKTNPYYTYGPFGNGDYRDMAGRNRIKIQELADKNDQNTTQDTYKAKNYSGSFRQVVVDKSYDEALYHGLEVTRDDVEAAFENVDRLNGNFPPGFGENDRPVLSRGNRSPKEEYFRKTEFIINQISDAKSKVSDFVNGRTAGIGGTITEWRGYINQIQRIENELLAFPSAFVPYELVNNIRQMQCDLLAIARFPELFADSIENAINAFRDLLKSSGCAQTL